MLDLVLYLYGLPEWGFLDVYTYIYINLRYIMKCSYIWASKTVCVNHLNIPNWNQLSSRKQYSGSEHCSLKCWPLRSLAVVGLKGRSSWKRFRQRLQKSWSAECLNYALWLQQEWWSQRWGWWGKMLVTFNIWHFGVTFELSPLQWMIEII